jgi:hypothetical protein
MLLSDDPSASAVRSNRRPRSAPDGSTTRFGSGATDLEAPSAHETDAYQPAVCGDDTHVFLRGLHPPALHGPQPRVALVTEEDLAALRPGGLVPLPLEVAADRGVLAAGRARFVRGCCLSRGCVVATASKSRQAPANVHLEPPDFGPSIVDHSMSIRHSCDSAAIGQVRERAQAASEDEERPRREGVRRGRRGFAGT